EPDPQATNAGPPKETPDSPQKDPLPVKLEAVTPPESKDKPAPNDTGVSLEGWDYQANRHPTDPPVLALKPGIDYAVTRKPIPGKETTSTMLVNETIQEIRRLGKGNPYWEMLNKKKDHQKFQTAFEYRKIAEDAKGSFGTVEVTDYWGNRQHVSVIDKRVEDANPTLRGGQVWGAPDGMTLKDYVDVAKKLARADWIYACRDGSPFDLKRQHYPQNLENLSLNNFLTPMMMEKFDDVQKAALKADIATSVKEDSANMIYGAGCAAQKMSLKACLAGAGLAQTTYDLMTDVSGEDAEKEYKDKQKSPEDGSPLDYVTGGTKPTRFGERGWDARKIVLGYMEGQEILAEEEQK
ncbi:MAG: hypothetical protein HQL51_10500, partial [Magnetococcales bacterium]|nr:hypothetical protein [Magnetococcales bacterium]